MKLKRSTLLLVGAALVLGAGVLIAETRQPQEDGAAVVDAAGDPLFTFAEDDVTALTVEQAEQTLTFEKDAEGRWQMTQPESGPAEPGAIAFLLSRLTTDASQQAVPMLPDQQGDFGFDPPAGEATLTLADGTTHRVILGGEDFSGESRYVLVDPASWPLPTGGDPVTVQVVAADVANAINRPLTEWKMATELEPSTPAAVPGQPDAPAALDNAPTLPNSVETAPAPPAPAAPAPQPPPEAETAPADSP